MRFLLIAIISTFLFAVNIDYYNQESLAVYNSITNKEYSLENIEAFFEEYPYSSSYLNALKNYYKLKMDLFNSFYSSKKKKIATYAYYREIINETDKGTIETFSEKNVADIIYESLKSRISTDNNAENSIQIKHNGSKYKELYEEEDVSIILNVELSIPEHIKSRDVLDLNINFQIYLSGIYFEKPIIDIYIRESFVNSQHNYNQAIEKIIKELEKNYEWRDINFIIKYLAGSQNYVNTLISRIENNADDYFAIKLLAISNWKFLQEKLLKENNAEGLIRANLMYPFSEEQSASIYQYAANVYEIRTKIKLLSYLGSAGYTELVFLLNEVLSEIDDIQLFELIGPILYMAKKYGDDETLEHLYLLQEMVFDYDDEVEQPFVALLNSVVPILERKYK